MLHVSLDSVNCNLLRILSDALGFRVASCMLTLVDWGAVSGMLCGEVGGVGSVIMLGHDEQYLPGV